MRPSDNSMNTAVAIWHTTRTLSNDADGWNRAAAKFAGIALFLHGAEHEIDRDYFADLADDAFDVYLDKRGEAK